MTPLIIGASGYIGSRLLADLPGAVAAEGRYQDLTAEYVRGFEAVIFLAGHTTVKRCEEDEHGAGENNVTGFAGLLKKLTRQQRFIFASTGAIYHGLTDATERDDGLPLFRYDQHKRWQEKWAAEMVEEWPERSQHWYALRLGTVCGASPKRDDRPLLNKLVADAIEKGRITIANPGAWRAIAALADVVEAVRVFLGERAPESGAYNVASVNATVGQCARIVAERLNAGISLAPDSVTYSFGMRTEKLQRYGWRPDWFTIIPELLAAREGREAA